MSRLMYALSVETFAPMLANLSALLDKAEAQLGPDAEALVDARLAPDMFPLSRQIQIACDTAKGCAGRLSGREPPARPDEEKTLAELKARIAWTIDYVKAAAPEAYEGAEERDIVLPLWEGMQLQAKGLRFLKDWSLPHFYFHVVTAYDILRHKGVELGKSDYVAHVGDMIVARPAA